MSMKFDRRRFLETAGKVGVGAVLGSLPLLDGCKGSQTTPEPPPPPPPPPVPVALEFTVYNHTKGLKGSFVRENVMSGTTLEIRVADLISQFGINDVDEKSIIFTGLDLRSAGRSFDGIGKFVVPRQSGHYYIFLLNLDGRELYVGNEAMRYPNRLIWGREIDVYRADFDGLIGHERIFGGESLPEIGENGIIDQFNAALNPESLPFSYGRITRKPAPNDGKGSYGYGFGDCHGWDAVAGIPSSYYSIYWVGIDPRVAGTVQEQVGAGLGAMLEQWMQGGFTYTPGINRRAQDVIQSDGIMNQKGKDFIAYLSIRGD